MAADVSAGGKRLARMAVLKNAKHERFAQELAKGKTATEAYKIAGYKPDDGNASKMAAKPDVQGRVQEITGRAAERAEVSVATILTELEEARSLASRLEQPSPMVSASMGKAKVAGLLTEKVEHTGKDGEPLPDTNPRDLARAVLGILREAGMEKSK